MTQFWPKDVVAWFAMAENHFRRHDVQDSQHRFDMVLSALSETTLEQVRGVLRMAATLQDPFDTLKRRLLELYTPDDLELACRILHAPELGNRKPSELMSSLLAMLPPGEQDGILFKTVFLMRLPKDIREHVATQVRVLSSSQLATLADQLYLARVARQYGNRPVMAVTGDQDELEEVEELAAGVAAITTKKPKPRFKGKGKGSSQSKKEPVLLSVCTRHVKYGDKAFSCEDPATCKWPGN